MIGMIMPIVIMIMPIVIRGKRTMARTERYWIQQTFGSARDPGVIRKKRRGAEEDPEQLESMEEAMTFGSDRDRVIPGYVWVVLDVQAQDERGDYLTVATFTTRGAAEEYAESTGQRRGPPAQYQVYPRR